jgi:hypothetical protein
MTTPENPEGPGQPTPDPTPPAESMPPAAPESKAAVSASGVGTPQGMVALGAFILIGVEVVFGLILDDFYISTTALLLAVVAALIFLGRSGTAAKLASVATVMKALGYLLAILGVFALVYDLRYASSALNEFTEIIGALAAYGGFALAFMGARSIET